MLIKAIASKSLPSRECGPLSGCRCTELYLRYFWIVSIFDNCFSFLKTGIAGKFQCRTVQYNPFYELLLHPLFDLNWIVGQSFSLIQRRLHTFKYSMTMVPKSKCEHTCTREKSAHIGPVQLHKQRHVYACNHLTRVYLNHVVTHQDGSPGKTTPVLIDDADISVIPWLEDFQLEQDERMVISVERNVQSLNIPRWYYLLYVRLLTSSIQNSNIHHFLRFEGEFVIFVKVLFSVFAPIMCDASDFVCQYFLAYNE